MATLTNSTSSKERLALVLSPLITCLILWVTTLIISPSDWIAEIIILVTLIIIYPAMLLTFFAIIKPIKKTFILNQVTLIFISVNAGFILSATIGFLYFKASPSEIFGFGIYGLVIALLTSVSFGLIAGYKFI
ncbi:hypothetical protein [Kangiella sp.]|uniref:hypothetical protein n=1 Tax=Kangiella sp. TaxID=1920245 RepID=UPI003A920BAF